MTAQINRKPHYAIAVIENADGDRAYALVSALALAKGDPAESCEKRSEHDSLWDALQAAWEANGDHGVFIVG